MPADKALDGYRIRNTKKVHKTEVATTNMQQTIQSNQKKRKWENIWL